MAALGPTAVENLSVLGPGKHVDNPSELLGSEAMLDVMTRLADHADFVIVDAPPITGASDALSMASHLHHVLLIADARYAKRGSIKEAVLELRSVGAEVLGRRAHARFEEGSSRLFLLLLLRGTAEAREWEEATCGPNGRPPWPSRSAELSSRACDTRDRAGRIPVTRTGDRYERRRPRATGPPRGDANAPHRCGNGRGGGSPARRGSPEHPAQGTFGSAMDLRRGESALRRLRPARPPL